MTDREAEHGADASLAAYLDGVDDPAARAAVEASPERMHRAAWMRAERASLARALARAACPEAFDLATYAAGDAAAPARLALSAHLAWCDPCRLELEALQAFLDETAPAAEAAGGSGAVLRRLAARVGHAGGPYAAPAFGLRGAADGEATFEEGDVRLTLYAETDPDDPNRRSLVALAHAGEAGATTGWVARLVPADGPPVEGLVDALGEAVFDGLAPGRYTLSLESATRAIVVAGISL